MANRIKWSIDPVHSEISFKVRHLMIARVQGEFKIFGANVSTDSSGDFSTAEVYLWLDTNSLTTGNAERDDHVKDVDFFNVTKYPQATFVSTSVGQPDVLGNRELWGELTIKGIVNAVKLVVRFGGKAQDTVGIEKAGFYVTGTINRNDWGLIWNSALDTGGLVLSDEVDISCEVELQNDGKQEIIKETVKATITNAFL